MPYSDFKSTVDSIVGEQCWLVIAGKGTGSVIHLGFGGKTPRKKPLKNLSLYEEERLFLPDASLIVSCSWRLSLSDKVLCSWRSSNEPDEKMIAGLSLLRLSKVCDISICPVFFDICLTFENNVALRVFCDITDDGESDNNYIFFFPDKIFTIDTKCALITEKRSSQPV